MRVVFRILTVLLAVSLIGTIQTRAELCEPATVVCRDGRPQSMDCCRPSHCHCDLNAASRSAQIPAPRAAAVSGREITKIASTPVAAMRFADSDGGHSSATLGMGSLLPTAASSYLLTHAFLI